MSQTARKSLRKATSRLSLDEIEKIFAVEGISLTPEMREDLERFEEEGLSPQERRRQLARKYGKSS